MLNGWRGSCELPLNINLPGLSCRFGMDVLAMEPVVDMDTCSA